MLHGPRPVRNLAPAASLLVAGVLLVTAVNACSPADTGPAEALVETAPGNFMRGTILPGESLSFRACGQEGALPLRPTDLFTRNLLDEITASGRPIYAEFLGRVGGRVPTMTLGRLVHATGEGRGCALPTPDYELRAHGNEPFWSVEIRDENVIWKTPENIEGLSLEVTSRAEVGNGWLLEAATDGSHLGVSFAGTPCRDSMADAWFGYTVQLELDGVEYRGCGRSGHDGG